ncbi:hypothetical protein SDC9_174140 [bioreactor metagenome]|uniref:Uncharacterized protein n=1 Tax=bioreactor metagenome TaxID=1076179 RepID=A0A645GJ28_9ZZZZ
MPELLERALALGLIEVAMDGRRVEAAVGQLVGQPLGGALGAGEDHHLADVRRLQQLADDLRLVEVVRLIDELGGVRHRGLRVLALGAHMHRMIEVRPCQCDDLGGHGGTEHQCLPGGRSHRGEALHVG